MERHLFLSSKKIGLIKNTIVAIHQPNFFPWLGFFDKLIKSDVFLLMDTAQIPNKKSSFTNKTKILIEKEEKWTPTIEIHRNSGELIAIKDTKMVENSVWRKKIFRTLEFNYSKSPYFHEVFPFIKDLILYPTNNLSEYNCHSINSILTRLGIDNGKLMKTSDLGFEMSKENLSELVVKMVKSVSGNIYLSGTGARSYMEKDIFDKSGIELVFQEFTHPSYPQFNTRTFIPGLSIIDALMNVGFEKLKKIIA